MKKNKKLSQKKRKCKLRQEHSRCLIEHKRKDKKYSDSASDSLFNEHVNYDESGYIQIELPEKINLDTGYDELALVLKKIRKFALREKKPIKLTFNNVKAISPSALLLLTAEIHRCRRIHGPKKVTGTYPAIKDIERVLEDSGVFNLIGVKARTKRKPKKFPMEYIDFVSNSTEVKGTVRKFRESILGTDITMTPQIRGRFYRAITEAMLNVKYHAYPINSVKQNPDRGRWWLTGHVNKKTKDLVIMFCDLGVGIAGTLPRIYPMERIRHALSLLPLINPDDAQMIKAAMELGRTRVAQENRGKGLNDIRSFIDQVNAGNLEIYSRKGLYRYKADGNEYIKNHDISIGGTLITWTVPLATVTNWTDSSESESYE